MLRQRFSCAPRARWGRSRSKWTLGLGLLLTSGLPARAAVGQTTFEGPAAPADAARYRWVETCLAATNRVQDSVRYLTPVWPDTMPYAYSARAARAPLPAKVAETARRCGARFDVETAPLDDFTPLLELYSEAGRDEDMRVLLMRRLAAIAPTAGRERAAILDTAVQIAIRHQPARLALAESLLVSRDQLGDTVLSLAHRFGRYGQFVRAARRVGDTVRYRWAAARVLAFADELSAADRRSNYYQDDGQQLVYNVLDHLAADSALDSLRRSTAAYVALKRAHWARASGEAPEALHFPIGEQAPAIEASFWFGRRDTTTARPAPGKVAVVFALSPECSRTCLRAYAALRRLAARFPEVEITLLAQTEGYFSAMAPPTPAEEADTWWEYVTFHQLPGALAVETTPFWRLPAPDRRRINQPTANRTNYSFGRSWSLKPFMAFLIDRSGTIVESSQGPLGSREAVRMASFIEILLDRQQTAGS